MSAGTVAGMLVWMPSNPCRRLQAHLVDDERTPVAALGDVAGVAEALHQLCPGSAHALGTPAGRRRLAGKPVARHRRDHDMESVRCAPAMCRGIGQRIDDLQLLDDRAGPSVRDDQRQRIFMLRTDVDEMDVQPIDLGDEMRVGVQLRLHLAPVVICRPMARELLHRGELHALRRVGNRFAIGPLRRGDAPAKLGDLLLRDIDGEWSDRIASARRP